MTATAESTAILQRAWSGRNGGTFLAWYDADRKKPTWQKLMDAATRYQQKFGRVPRFCLTSPQDAADLHKRPYALVTHVEARGYIARHTFYIGEDNSAEVLARMEPEAQP